MEKQPNSVNFNDATVRVIPARIVIGVTGHRKIENPALLGASLQTSLEKIRQMVPALKSTPLIFSVLSPLAEGADRLLAREILKIPGSMLEVVLPFKKEDYLQDFVTDSSRKEFEELLALAKSVTTFASEANRPAAYEQVGRYIVEQCDVLIAVWDGKPSAGRGGTQEIVAYARDNQCPLVWINPENYSQINFELGHGLNSGPYRDLDIYNRNKVDPDEYGTHLRRDIRFFIDHAERTGLPLQRVSPTISYLMNHYVYGDKLALCFQHLYYRSDTLIYSLALAAVMIAAFQDLFLPDKPIILVSEIVLMVAVLGIVWLGRRQRWHEKWIDYRFLAERFRSALFMAITDVNVAILRPPRHLSLAYSPKDWIVAAFSTIWRLRPRIPVSEPLPLEKVKQFIIEAWLEDQIRYHESTGRRHLARYRLMTISSYILFGLTIVAVLLFVVGGGPDYVKNTFSFLAIVFPAIAACLTGIKTHRDYLRNSLRSMEMARHLKELKDRMSRTEDRRAFSELVKEIEETMLHENEDWRVVVRFHETEIPV